MKAAAARANAVTWDKGSGVRPGSQWVVHIGFGAAKVKQRVFLEISSLKLVSSLVLVQ